MRRGLTITEVLVTTVVIAILLAALLPTMHRLRADSGQIASASNLAVIGLAHAAYAADHNDRQVTWVPDDMGLTNGDFFAYANNFGCPSAHILGFGETGSIWGYFLPCHGAPNASWGVSAFYTPNTWVLPINGSFRSPGSKAFAAYVDGRYYSPLLYAPNDTITMQRAAPYLDLPVEFTVLPAPNDSVVYSSYAFSPASMWDPKVLSKDRDSELWWRHPNTLPIGYRSPTVSSCLHPELKTRTIEHNWNFGQPGPINPAFAGDQTPYFFSHGLAASPLTLFFDGRVAELPNTQVAADDAQVLASTGGEVGLWTRDTPHGADGYYGGFGFDEFVTGHHILTAGGIQGRDILSVKPPGGLAGAPAPGHRRASDPRERALESGLLAPPGSELVPTTWPSE